MTLRVKLIVAFVALSLAATIAVALGTYVSTANNFDSEINRSLNEASTEVLLPQRFGARAFGQRQDGDDRGGIHPLPRGYERFVVQKLSADGTIDFTPQNGALPVDALDRRIAASTSAGVQVRRNIHVHRGTANDDDNWRVETISLGSHQGAVQIARSTAETDRLLESLRARSLLAVAIAAVVAGLVGWLIARGITRRLVHLTETAERVAATGVLDVSANIEGRDEAGRLGIAFNAMLASLARSKHQQHQLVHDASHELRTPLTSLRTNVSMLRSFERLDADDQRRVLDDLDSETRELTALVNELVELATDRHNSEASSLVPFAPIVAAVVERARRRTDRTIELTINADRAIVNVAVGGIQRAISNLVDNAIKFSAECPPTATIDVVVTSGRVTVSDRGPGFSATDAERLFERFYRTDEARSLPGSGLGLAIVRETIEAHEGQVFAAPRLGGGAAIGFELPVDSHHSHTALHDDANLDPPS